MNLGSVEVNSRDFFSGARFGSCFGKAVDFGGNHSLAYESTVGLVWSEYHWTHIFKRSKIEYLENFAP